MRRGTVWIPVIASGVLAGGLALGAGIALSEYFRADSAWPMLGAAVGVWAAWTALFAALEFGRGMAVAHALHRHDTRRRSCDRHTEGAQRAERGEAVLALEESLDVRRALRDAAEHQGTVRHRLVAGDAQAPARRGGRRDAPGSSRRGRAQRSALKGRRADRNRARGTATRGP